MDLYHVDIRLPNGFVLPARTILLKWTEHAKRARLGDRYGEIPWIPLINLRFCQPIEVGMENGRVCKVVVRTELDDERDLVLVLIPHQPSRDTWTLKTVWINEINDTHKTLDRSRYVC